MTLYFRLGRISNRELKGGGAYEDPSASVFILGISNRELKGYIGRGRRFIKHYPRISNRELKVETWSSIDLSVVLHLK